MARNYGSQVYTFDFVKIRSLLYAACKEYYDEKNPRQIYVKFLQSYGNEKDSCIIWLNGSPIRAYIICKLNQNWNNLWVYGPDGTRLSIYSANIIFNEFPKECFKDSDVKQ